MLELTTYTKQQLVDIFHSDKMCNITRKLDSLGYKYTTNGRRGENYRLTIKELPVDAFKIFCIDELGVSANSDFRILKHFFYFFFCDEEFQQKPIGEMERIMQKECTYITRQTIAKWIKLLKDKDIITDSSECIYFATVTTSISTESIQIPHELYLKAWKVYWDIRNNGGSYSEAFNAMCRVNGGTVYKKHIIEENGFCNKLINKLIEAIESETQE